MSSGNLENFVIYFSWSWKLILQKINFKLQKLLSIWVFYSTSKSSIIYGSIEEAMKSTSITCYNMCSQLLPKPFCTIYPKVRILSDCRFTILFTVFMVLCYMFYEKNSFEENSPVMSVLRLFCFFLLWLSVPSGWKVKLRDFLHVFHHSSNFETK